jgi:hypothetical protein
MLVRYLSGDWGALEVSNVQPLSPISPVAGPSTIVGDGKYPYCFQTNDFENQPIRKASNTHIQITGTADRVGSLARGRSLRRDLDCLAESGRSLCATLRIPCDSLAGFCKRGPIELDSFIHKLFARP